MENSTTFYERLQLAMAHAQCDPRDLAMAMGVTPAALRQLHYSTTGQARADNAMRAADYLRVDPRWLILGVGRMLPSTTTWPFDKVTPAQWESIPPDSRAILQDIIRAYADRHLPHKVK